MKTALKKSLPVPCSEWANRLAALHPDDLTPEDQAALKEHIASCSNCAAVFSAYQAMDASILSLPQPLAQPISGLEALITDQNHDDPRVKSGATVEKRPVRRPPRLARLERQVSLVAAALIVLVLAGSVFALFSLRHAPTSTATGASGVIYAVSSDGTAYAVDTGTGKVIWSTALHMKASEQFLVSSGTFYLGSSDYNLYALQTSTGKLLWKRSYKDLSTVGNQTVEMAPYPASDGTAIYFGTPKGIYAWRASDGKQLWSYPAPKTCSPLSGICPPEVATVSHGIVYTYLDGLYALNASDGTLRWKDARVPGDTTLVVAQNQVYVASYNGKDMRVLQANTGQLLNTPGLPNISPFDMITDGNTVYLRGRNSGTPDTSDDVYAVRSANNTTIWHKQLKGLSFSDVREGSLYYTYETASSTGPSLPHLQLTPVTITSLFDSHFCAVSTRDGSAQWCRQLPSNFSPQLAAASQGTMYITTTITTTDKLEAIRISDGKVLWAALSDVSLARIELD